MTPITPDALREAGWQHTCGTWSFELPGELFLDLRLDLMGEATVAVEDGWSDIEIPRRFETMQELLDLIRVLRGA